MNTSLPKQLLRHARDLGPYLATALVLPGGTVLAILLWLSQRRRKEA